MTYELVSYSHFWYIAEYGLHYDQCGLSERARIMSDVNRFWFDYEQDETETENAKRRKFLPTTF